MNIQWSITESVNFKHIRAECLNDRTATEADFIAAIEERFPGEKVWRFRPARLATREFNEDCDRIRFYARFSIARPERKSETTDPDFSEAFTI